ncbi:MAG TPA: hypothetical protein VMZ00_05110 [Sporichthya sp.]|nr:hypothetical protein [Sporichthya sp.]
MRFAGQRVVITGPLTTAEEFDEIARVADLVRESGGFPVWAGDIAGPIEAEFASVAELAEVEARILQGADFIIAMPGWEDSPHAFMDVLTAEQAGAELVEIG